MAENSKMVEKVASTEPEQTTEAVTKKTGSKKTGATGKKMRPKTEKTAEVATEKATEKKPAAKKTAPKTTKKPAPSTAKKPLKKELDDVVAEKAEKAELATEAAELSAEKTALAKEDAREPAPAAKKTARPEAVKTEKKSETKVEAKSAEKPAVQAEEKTKIAEKIEAAKADNETNNVAAPAKMPKKEDAKGTEKETSKEAGKVVATSAETSEKVAVTPEKKRELRLETKTEAKPRVKPAEKPVAAATAEATETAVDTAAQQNAAQDMSNLKKPAKKSATGGGSKAERRRRAKEAAAQAMGQPRAARPATEAPATDKPVAIEQPDTEQPHAQMQGELTAEQVAAEEARAAEMTKTLQVSLEQILAGVDEADTTTETFEAENDLAEKVTDDPATNTPAWAQNIVDTLGDGAVNIGKWIVLVLVLVLLIAGGEIAWLYHNATPDAISSFTVSFNQEQLSPSAYQWNVPVVGNLLKRSYKETLQTEPQQLPTMESTAIDLAINPQPSETTLTITDAAGTEVYNGTASGIENEVFDEVGHYEGKLVLTQKSYANDDASVTGHQTYLFDFAVQPRPTVRLNTRSVPQGGVAAIRITGVTDDALPVITTNLDCGAITPVQSEDGWVAYLPIPREQERGEYFVKVKDSGYTEDLTLNVTDKTWQFKDYSSTSQFTSPYVSLEDTPEEVQRALAQKSGDVAWDSNGFVQPITTSITVKLAYGTTEYAGRTSSQRVKGTGEGRVATSVVLGCNSGTSLISPAAGKVILAEDLGGSAGNTVVIDHGAGVRSVFYNLRYISVEKGTELLRGQQFATTNSTLIGEVRIGSVPVEPLSVWRGQCDALKYF